MSFFKRSKDEDKNKNNTKMYILNKNRIKKDKEIDGKKEKEKEVTQFFSNQNKKRKEEDIKEKELDKKEIDDRKKKENEIAQFFLNQKKVVKEEKEELSVSLKKEDIKGPEILRDENKLTINDVIEKKEEARVENNLKNNDKTAINTPTEIQISNDSVIKSEKDVEKPNKNDKDKKDISKHQTKEPINYRDNYLEKQIIFIIDDTIRENSYQLKLLEHDLHIMTLKTQKSMEQADINDVEKEIYEINQKIEELKKLIETLEKNMKLKFFPCDDNYLIYLMDQYKEQLKDDKFLKDQFIEYQKSTNYKNVLDSIVEIEYRRDKIEEDIIEKKNEIDIRDSDMILIEKESLRMEESTKMILEVADMQQKALEEIEELVNKTVTVSDYVETVMRHSGNLLGKLLLMGQIMSFNPTKNANGMIAAESLLVLDMIKEMCTPKEEQVIRKQTDVVDYEKIIKNAINDSTNVDNLIKDGLNSVGDLRDSFEHDFSEFSHMKVYEDTMNRLEQVEKEMLKRQDYMKRIHRDMQYQLDKNNAKVKKYGTIENEAA